MKQGRSLTELAAELTRIKESSTDVVGSTLDMTFNENGHIEMPALDMTVKPTPWAHGQIASATKIPKVYYDQCLQHAKPLLAVNVQHWWSEKPMNRLVRVIDNDKCRAFLSDSYKVIDNYDVANEVLVLLHEARATIESCEVTEKKLYIKAIFREEKPVNTGDFVKAGVLISNSEVGAGSFVVRPLVYRLVCKNGMILDEYAVRQVHRGRKAEDYEMRYLTEETKSAMSKVVIMKARDLIAAMRSDAFFSPVVERIAATRSVAIDQPEKAVMSIKKRRMVTEGERGGILQALMEQKDYTQFGMANAITQFAQDVDSYDRSTELERLGGSVAMMSSSAFTNIIS